MKYNFPCLKCPSSDAMVEYPDAYYCFSCHTLFPHKGRRYVRESKSTIPTWEQSHTEYNPDNFPIDILKWLTGYGIYSSHIKKYKLGVNEVNGKQALSFPFWDTISNSIQIGSQYRFFPIPSVPKYKTIGQTSLGKSMPLDISLYPGVLVLVEDMVSMIRVGEFVETWALCGTGLSTISLSELIRTNVKTLLIWLDGDIPGKTEATKIAKRLRQWHNIVIVKNVLGDPKDYPNTEIKNILTKYLEV